MFYVLFWPLSSQKLCYTPTHRLSHQPHGMCSTGRGPVAPASGSRAWTWRVCRLIPCLRARERCFPRKVKTRAPAVGPCPGPAVTFESVRQRQASHLSFPVFCALEVSSEVLRLGVLSSPFPSSFSSCFSQILSVLQPLWAVHQAPRHSCGRKISEAAFSLELML